MHRDDRGSASVAGLFFALILIVLAAAIVDVYRLQDTRTFAYSAANDAALRGASFGRDWNRFMATGVMYLDPNAATSAAQYLVVGQFATATTDLSASVAVSAGTGPAAAVEPDKKA